MVIIWFIYDVDAVRFYFFIILVYTNYFIIKCHIYTWAWLGRPVDQRLQSRRCVGEHVEVRRRRWSHSRRPRFCLQLLHKNNYHHSKKEHYLCYIHTLTGLSSYEFVFYPGQTLYDEDDHLLCLGVIYT